MTKYSKASDSLLNVVDAKGKAHRVTQRAFEVVYKAQGYKLASDADEVKEVAKPSAVKKKPPKKEDAKTESR